MSFEKELEELEKRRAKALEMGGAEKIRKQHDKGKLSARERIDRLLDPGSFLEVGMFNHSDVAGMEEKTPADSKVAGYGKIDGRQVVVISNDFTVLAATSSRIAGRKEGELKLLAAHRGYPVIYLGEAGGARMPDIMGSAGLASYGGGGFDTYLQIMSRIRQAPMITAIMGECYGMPTWMACLSDFVVQVKGSAMDTDGIDKVISFLCLCDSFNIPLIFFHDIPGFLVGKAAERKRVAARVMNYMNALGLLTVRRISIIVRKTYGMAFWNMCGSGCGADFLVAWPSAEMSFVDPAIAANVVYGGKPSAADKESDEWQSLVQQLVDDASPYGAAGKHYIHDVIDPRETRNYIVNALEISYNHRRKGIGEHKLANWPTKS